MSRRQSGPGSPSGWGSEGKSKFGPCSFGASSGSQNLHNRFFSQIVKPNLAGSNRARSRPFAPGGYQALDHFGPVFPFISRNELVTPASTSIFLANSHNRSDRRFR